MQLQLLRWLPVNHNQNHNFENCDMMCNTSWGHGEQIPLQHIYTFTISFQAGASLGSDRNDSSIPIPQQLYPYKDKCCQQQRKPQAPKAQTLLITVSNMDLSIWPKTGCITSY